jgi:hypothetical protein
MYALQCLPATLLLRCPPLIGDARRRPRHRRDATVAIRSYDPMGRVADVAMMTPLSLIYTLSSLSTFETPSRTAHRPRSSSALARALDHGSIPPWSSRALRWLASGHIATWPSMIWHAWRRSG